MLLLEMASFEALFMCQKIGIIQPGLPMPVVED
jgi:hypothetical protein